MARNTDESFRNDQTPGKSEANRNPILVQNPDPILIRSLRWLVRVEKGIAVTLMIILIFFSFVQVVARFVFDSPFAWTDELARFSYVWMTFIAAAAVMAKREHIAVELGNAKFSALVNNGLNAFGSFAVFSATLVLAVGSFPMLLASASGSSTAMDIPLPIFYGIVYAALVLTCLHAAINVVYYVGKARGRQDIARAEDEKNVRVHSEVKI